MVLLDKNTINIVYDMYILLFFYTEFSYLTGVVVQWLIAGQYVIFASFV